MAATTETELTRLCKIKPRKAYSSRMGPERIIPITSIALKPLDLKSCTSAGCCKPNTFWVSVDCQIHAQVAGFDNPAEAGANSKLRCGQGARQSLFHELLGDRVGEIAQISNDECAFIQREYIAVARHRGLRNAVGDHGKETLVRLLGHPGHIGEVARLRL